MLLGNVLDFFNPLRHKSQNGFLESTGGEPASSKQYLS